MSLPDLGTLRRLDFRPKPLVFSGPGTYYGAAETVLFWVALVAFAAWFGTLYFVETTINTDTVPTDGHTYTVTFQCVGHNGCNVTYLYPDAGQCSRLNAYADAYYVYRDNFTIEICRSREFASGVIIWGTFDGLFQGPVLGKTWLAELTQPLESSIPLPDYAVTKLRVTTLRQRVDIDEVKDHVISTLWEMTGAVNSVTRPECAALTLPFGWGCGGYLIKPDQFFVHRLTTRSGNLRADVFAPVLAISSVLLAISKCIAQTKISHKEVAYLAERAEEDDHML